MKSICFFSSYFNQPTIPYYIKYYLEELTRHFTEVVLLTNEKNIPAADLDYLKNKNILLLTVKNEGYDFGMWHKAFQRFDVSKYDRIGLINDSSILFKSLAPVFEWVNKNNYDYCGLIDSISKGYHIQSYFVIINKNAIHLVAEYFMHTGIVNGYNEVILSYEIGLSQHLLNKGMKLGAMYNKRHKVTDRNPSFFIITDLIKDGIPMIKKKIIFRSYRLGDYLTWFRTNFNIDHRFYIKKIIEANTNISIIDFAKVMKDAGYDKSQIDIYAYNFVLAIYRIASKSNLLKYLFHRLIDVKRFFRIKF